MNAISRDPTKYFQKIFVQRRLTDMQYCSLFVCCQLVTMHHSIVDKWMDKPSMIVVGVGQAAWLKRTHAY